jgi:hypothetical protein
VEQFRDVRKENFVEKYTSLVQRLSLLLLQVRGQLRGTLSVAPPQALAGPCACNIRTCCHAHASLYAELKYQTQFSHH